ncbi:MAG: hypothetical protein LBG15_07505 [Dysgonamonadaceae bacterium]|jgi:hypothetical protein|nr:hypothetical protein [Dysgonamonadaceae bacterium]
MKATLNYSFALISSLAPHLGQVMASEAGCSNRSTTETPRAAAISFTLLIGGLPFSDIAIEKPSIHALPLCRVKRLKPSAASRNTKAATILTCDLLII